MAVSYERGNPAPHSARQITQQGVKPRKALRGSVKGQFLKVLSTFGDKRPSNGSKNVPNSPKFPMGHFSKGLAWSVCGMQARLRCKFGRITFKFRPNETLAAHRVGSLSLTLSFSLSLTLSLSRSLSLYVPSRTPLTWHLPLPLPSLCVTCGPMSRDLGGSSGVGRFIRVLGGS